MQLERFLIKPNKIKKEHYTAPRSAEWQEHLTSEAAELFRMSLG